MYYFRRFEIDRMKDIKSNEFNLNNIINEVKVTVIIPVHNSEKYLKECVESALLQTFEDIEILCIDGESTDSSAEIIKKIQDNDNRVVYITDSNTGYGHKLNLGIRQARGKYIAILESDDKMSPEMLESLYDISIQYNVDIVDSDFYRFFHYKDREYRDVVSKYHDLECYDHFIEYTNDKEKEIATHGIWTALYKKEFLEKQNICLNESAGASYQDTSFLFLTSLLAGTVYHLRVPLYQYRVDNMGSSVKDDKKLFEIISECEFLKQELEKRDIWNETVQKLYYIRKYKAFYWNYCRLSSKSRVIFLERYIEEINLDIQRGFISREMFGEPLYNRTFLLIDNKDKFVDVILENDKYAWREGVGELLDKIEGRDIIIFGAGRLGTRLLMMLRQSENRIKSLCDNSSQLWNMEKCGVKVISVQEAIKQFRDVLYVIANRKHAEEMKEQLKKYGIAEVNIYIF